jgi:hypothetical protein
LFAANCFGEGTVLFFFGSPLASLAFQVADFLLGGDRVSVGGYEPVVGGVHFALYLLLALREAVEIGELLAAP